MKLFAKTAVLAAALLLSGVTASAQTTLTVEVFDRAAPGYVANDNWQTRWIKEQVKKELNIDVQFVTVPRGQEVDKLNLLMAAGQAPDISFTYNESLVANYVKQGGLTDLTKILPVHGKDLTKYLGDELMAFGEWGGKQWAVPAKRVFTGAYSGFIRQDWLDKLKLKVPTTTDELYNVLKAFRDKDPGAVGKDKVIPLAITVDNNNVNWTSNLIWEAFRKKAPEEVRVSAERWTVPGHKDAVQYLNKLYNEKLLTPNFVLDKDGQQYVKDIVQGNVGAAFHNWDNIYRANPGMATELAKNVPGASFVPFELQNRETKLFSKWKYNPNGLFLFVPRFSKNAEAAVKYLNWMARPEVLQYLQNGKEGVQYMSTKNGIPVEFVPQAKLADADKWDANDISILVNGKEFGSQDKNLEALSLGYSGYESLAKQAATISMRDAYVSFRFDEILVLETKYRQTLNTKSGEIFVKSITAKPSDFNKVFDSLLKEYMDAGGRAIEEEKRTAYRAQMAAKQAN